MVVMGEVEETALGAYGSALRIVSSEVNMTYMGLDDRAGAHIAGLEGNIQVTAEEMPGGELPAGFRDTDHLRVESRILFRLAEVVCPGDDPAVFYDDAADRGFAEIIGLLRLFERGAHVLLMYLVIKSPVIRTGRNSQGSTPFLRTRNSF